MLSPAGSTLPLLVTFVGANNVDAAFASYDFAILTNFPNAGADFHRDGLAFSKND